MPKTLIFAKDDNHAEEIVTTVREVFGKGNDFAAKITHSAKEPKRCEARCFSPRGHFRRSRVVRSVTNNPPDVGRSR